VDGRIKAFSLPLELSIVLLQCMVLYKIQEILCGVKLASLPVSP
jgi:hypothetical protein